MVIVNCASLPASLIESELFGREAGAYTGAASAQVGRFAVADGSTLFLDEIGEFPVELQAKLLRVLQDGRFERLGSPETMTVDVRIIAATNRDLEQAVREGKFRPDLFHRLNVFPIHVPPLRERPEDIPALVWNFVEVLGRRMGKTIKSIPRKTIGQLQRYSWPGNVRELSNIIERAMILAAGDTLHVELPAASQPTPSPRMTLKEVERAQILRVLQETGWRTRGPRALPRFWGPSRQHSRHGMARLASAPETETPTFRRGSPAFWEPRRRHGGGPSRLDDHPRKFLSTSGLTHLRPAASLHRHAACSSHNAIEPVALIAALSRTLRFRRWSDQIQLQVTHGRIANGKSTTASSVILDSLSDGGLRPGSEDRLLEQARRSVLPADLGGCCLPPLPDDVLCHVDKDNHKLCGEERSCPLHRSMIM